MTYLRSLPTGWCWATCSPRSAELPAAAGLPPGAAARPLAVQRLRAGADRRLRLGAEGLRLLPWCVHATAEAFGVDEGLIAALLDDVDAAPVEARMQPVLRHVRKLTLTPSQMTATGAEDVPAAEWDEQALRDAASVCGLFNLMNRLVEGLGVHADPG